jgi:hypothetical protein
MQLKAYMRAAALASAGALTLSPQTKHIPKIASINVDADIPVMGPDGVTNISHYPNYGLTTLADEHSTALPPWTLLFQEGYLFFVATRTTLNPNESGVVVLEAKGAPGEHQPWALDMRRDTASTIRAAKPATATDSSSKPPWLTRIAPENSTPPSISTMPIPARSFWTRPILSTSGAAIFSCSMKEPIVASG